MGLATGFWWAATKNRSFFLRSIAMNRMVLGAAILAVCGLSANSSNLSAANNDARANGVFKFVQSTGEVITRVTTTTTTTNGDSWRWKRYNNEWWYWLPSNRWVVYRYGNWVSPDAVVTTYSDGYYGDGYYGNNGYYGTGYYGNGYNRPYYGNSYYNGWYGTGYRGYYGDGYGRYNNGYYGGYYGNSGVRQGAAIGGVVGGRQGAAVGAGIGASFGSGGRGSRR